MPSSLRLDDAAHPPSPSKSKPRLPTSLAALGALAAGLCDEADLGIEAHMGGWAFDHRRRVILVDQRDLERRGLDGCAGIVAHEVGHVFLSRYHLASIAFPAPRLGRLLLNLFEDARVNEHMARRFPGIVPWLAAAYEDERPFDFAQRPLVLAYVQIALADLALRWSSSSEEPVPVPAHALLASDAADATADARRRYTHATQPRDDDVRDPSLLLRYRARVAPRLVAPASFACRTLREIAVRLRAFDALALAEADILPVVRTLWDHDVRAFAATLARVPDASQALARGDLACLLDVMYATPWGEPHEGAEPPRALIDLAASVLDAFYGGIAAGPGAAPVVRVDHTPGRSTDGDHELSSASPTRQKTAPSAYETVRRSVLPQIASLSATLEDVLPSRRRSPPRGGHPSGARLDLRVAREVERDPRLIDHAWRRRTCAARHDAAVGLLVDLSGSMSGPKIHAAIAAAVLLVETLEGLDVPHRVDGFQDVIVPFLAFGTTRSDPERARLVDMALEVEGERPHGNNSPLFNDDGPCVAEACLSLEAEGARDAMLFVLSDGLPEGRRSTVRDLELAVRRGGERGTRLIGIGVGPGTQHVKRFYPEAVADVRVDALSTTLAELLTRNLGRR